jgi:hypothetical protein
MTKYLLFLLLALLAACSSGSGTTADGAAAGVNPGEWYNLPLTNARTGATFKLADFAGKTVFVKPMAIW